jgi:adenylate cyclase, class 2
MATNTSLEIEIKLWIPTTLPQIRRAIKMLKFERTKRRILEQNIIFDTPGLSLRRKGEIIRVRRVGKRSILTYKGPPKGGRHKSREELECDVDDPDRMQQILERLGYHPVFRYEKFREEYERPGQHGTITVDETPIGNFLELEGAPKWIDKTARQLGFSRADYITRSYGNLYLAWCQEHGIAPSDMVFQTSPRRPRSSR